ncbi:hypothetical protein AWW70_13655 [Bacillus mycoides]|uniref:DUF3888 domain-containing protein n=1 Tax=Bacillus mycoides TaxID=1405 RepID=A0A109G917_BACMY|nr:DUF3888 domain-containing protein [Bacillus mycoides]KWU62467.1 hypothetical protein AWW70_13655 [Bacillus mycoides]
MRKIYGIIVMTLLIFQVHPLHSVYAQEQQLKHKLIKETLLLTLNHEIEKTIFNYYGEVKQYSLYDIEIVNIEKVNGTFIIKMRVHTFNDAHNPPYGKETITFKMDGEGVSVISFQHEGDEWEKKINTFYNRVIFEIEKAFNLQLETYKKYNNEQLLYKADQQNNYKSLSNIIVRITTEILKADISSPYKNIITPISFVKGDQGYILFKRADGRNVVCTVEKENDEWKVVEMNYKTGKKLGSELLWYM